MKKEPLYRKVNSKARGCHHHIGLDAKHDRNTKKGISTKMKKDVQRGLDYTPLFRFLLSKVGQNFDKIYSEAVSRLDKPEAIYYMVDDSREYFKSENAYYPTLKVDSKGLLQFVNPNLKNEDFYPSCSCCTYTFNGKPLIKKYLNNPEFHKN